MYNEIHNFRKKYPNLVSFLNNYFLYPYRRFVTDVKSWKNKSNIYNISYEEKEIKFFLPYKYDLIEQTIIAKKTFFEQAELKIVKPYIKPNAVVVDIGANIGNHLIFFGVCCNTSRIIGFEPNQTIFPILQKNIILNNLSEKVQLYQNALGSKRGKGRFSNDFPTSHQSYTNKSINEDNCGEIEIVPLSSILNQKIDFIKIDVEGMEVEVLKGAKPLIKLHKPLMFIETGQINKVMEELSGLDYHIERELANNNYILVPA